MMKKLIALLLSVTVVFQMEALAAEQDKALSRAQAHTELGAAYFSAGQLAVALEELNEAVKADSRYAPAYNMLGLVYMELREHAKAEENFEQALDRDAANPDIHNNFGWFLCQRKRVDEAIKHFFSALKNPLYSTPEKSYLNAGVCSLKINDEQGATEFFLKAFKLRPQQAQAAYYLGELSLKRKDYTEAKKYFVAMPQTELATAAGLWLGVRVERKLGNRDAETAHSLQLRKKFPDSSEAQALRNGDYEFVEFAKSEGKKGAK